VRRVGGNATSPRRQPVSYYRESPGSRFESLIAAHSLRKPVFAMMQSEEVAVKRQGNPRMSRLFR